MQMRVSIHTILSVTDARNVTDAHRIAMKNRLGNLSVSSMANWSNGRTSRTRSVVPSAAVKAAGIAECARQAKQQTEVNLMPDASQRPETAPRYRGATATYVQAWECKSANGFSGCVYSQEIALDKMGEGCDIESVTIVRHDDGTREFLPGTIASYVYAYRET